jgi:hypothetical protein
MGVEDILAAVSFVIKNSNEAFSIFGLCRSHVLNRLSLRRTCKDPHLTFISRTFQEPVVLE